MRPDAAISLQVGKFRRLPAGWQPAFPASRWKARWLSRSGRRRRLVAPTRALSRQQSREVVDQREVEKNNPGGEGPRVSREVHEFPGEIKTSGDDGKPLGPVFALPQPAAFREPNQRVSKAHSGDLSLMMVGGPGHGFDE